MIADEGDARAALKVSYMFKYGYGVKSSPTMSFVYCQQAAMSGDPSALCSLALKYEECYGVKQSYFNAFKNFLVSAEKKCFIAYYLVADMYKRGLGTKKSSELALKFFQIAIDNGDKHAKDALANWENCRSSEVNIPEDQYRLNIHRKRRYHYVKTT